MDGIDVGAGNPIAAILTAIGVIVTALVGIFGILRERYKTRKDEEQEDQAIAAQKARSMGEMEADLREWLAEDNQKLRDQLRSLEKLLTQETMDRIHDRAEVERLKRTVARHEAEIKHLREQFKMHGIVPAPFDEEE